MEYVNYHTEIYQYNLLPGQPPHLRLLYLATDGPYDERLDCTLREFCFFSSTEPCPRYAALSYTWGPPERNDDESVAEKPPRYVNVNDKPLPVSENLFQGLRKVKRWCQASEETGIHLWIDAICIDQNNYEEKGKQVDMMGEIYRRANRVIVWLGDCPENEGRDVKIMVQRAAALVRSVSNRAPGTDERTNYHSKGWHLLSETDKRRELDLNGLPPRHSVQWLQFWRFFKRRWFSRIWAIQELVLASKVEYLCGVELFHGEDVMHSTDFLYWEIKNWAEVVSQTSEFELMAASRNVFVIDDLYHDAGRFQYHDRIALAGPQARSQSPWTFLINLLYSSRRHCATIEKDKVYGLLGLIRTKASLTPEALKDFIRADYNKSSNTVFTEAVQGIISDTEWLGSLILVENRPELDKLQTRSYVPNFAARGDQFGIGWQVFEDVLPPLVKLSSDAPSGGIPSLDGDVLKCQGIQLDRLDLVSESFSELFDGKTDFAKGVAIIASSGSESVWRAMLAGDKRLHDKTDLRHSFLCFCLHRLKDYLVSTGRLHELPADASISVLAGEASMQNGSISTDQVRRMLSSQDDNLSIFVRTEAQDFEAIFSCHYIDRALFRTCHGWLGTCMDAMRPGDEIWFVAQSPCPLVLRRVDGVTGDHFKLVGWAFLQGFPSRTSFNMDWVGICIV